MDPDSVPVDSGCDSVLGIPVTVPAEFEFRSEFHRNGNYNLAGTSAKFPFPQNSWNHPDSRGFHLEYVGDCKELLLFVHTFLVFLLSHLSGLLCLCLEPLNPKFPPSLCRMRI